MKNNSPLFEIIVEENEEYRINIIKKKTNMTKNIES